MDQNNKFWASMKITKLSFYAYYLVVVMSLLSGSVNADESRMAEFSDAILRAIESDYPGIRARLWQPASIYDCEYEVSLEITGPINLVHPYGEKFQSIMSWSAAEYSKICTSIHTVTVRVSTDDILNRFDESATLLYAKFYRRDGWKMADSLEIALMPEAWTGDRGIAQAKVKYEERQKVLMAESERLRQERIKNTVQIDPKSGLPVGAATWPFHLDVWKLTESFRNIGLDETKVTFLQIDHSANAQIVLCNSKGSVSRVASTLYYCSVPSLVGRADDCAWHTQGWSIFEPKQCKRLWSGLGGVYLAIEFKVDDIWIPNPFDATLDIYNIPENQDISAGIERIDVCGSYEDNFSLVTKEFPSFQDGGRYEEDVEYPCDPVSFNVFIRRYNDIRYEVTF